ncbi:MAG: RDD family protein [Burkholderiales bacterium]|nr:RDD family protein [Burkholderiales bacterium]MBX3717601.1 RDD family protein [Burkholderiales bacterium]
MAAGPPRAPGAWRRLACAVYESLILAALVLFATFPYLAFAGDSTAGWRRHLLQAWVLLVAGGYFVGFWTHGGQTIAMKTWRIRVESAEGGAVGTGRAVRRYLFALLGAAAAGLGYLWALVDRDGQFLHDRLAGTRLADLRDPRR